MDSTIIKEFAWFAKKAHAELVFRKCLKAGRLKWAMIIAYEYGLQMEESHCDTVLALGMTIKAENILKD